jgi:hypothetical protein
VTLLYSTGGAAHTDVTLRARRASPLRLSRQAHGCGPRPEAQLNLSEKSATFWAPVLGWADAGPGTDLPTLFLLKREGVDLVNKIGLTDEEKNEIYCENAKRLLKL